MGGQGRHVHYLRSGDHHLQLDVGICLGHCAVFALASDKIDRASADPPLSSLHNRFFQERDGAGYQPERPNHGDKGCRHKGDFLQPVDKLTDLRRGDALHGL